MNKGYIDTQTDTHHTDTHVLLCSVVLGVLSCVSVCCVCCVLSCVLCELCVCVLC